MAESQLPDIDLKNIPITKILKSLSDPTRLAIITRLENDETEISCAEFDHLGKKSNLSQHYRNLRLSGLISIRREGRHSYLSLRKDDLDKEFPDLIESIVKSINGHNSIGI